MARFILLILFCTDCQRRMDAMNHASPVLVALALLSAFATNGTVASPTPAGPKSVNEIAEAYVKLVLALGQHDPDYVDAYYGPPEWKNQQKRSLDAIAAETAQLRNALESIPRSTDEME